MSYEESNSYRVAVEASFLNNENDYINPYVELYRKVSKENTEEN